MGSYLSEPENIQRTSHRGLYRYAFGELLTNAENAIDFGAGDNDYYKTAASLGQKLIRVDASYSSVPPVGVDYIGADCRDYIVNLNDNSYDVSVASFLLQHLSNPDMKSVIEQMVRVTRPRCEPEKNSGLIMLFPVFRPSRLKKIIDYYDSTVSAGYVVPLEEFKRPFEYMTLLINKTEETVDIIPDVIEEVVESGAMRPSSVNRAISNFGKTLIALGVSEKTKKY